MTPVRTPNPARRPPRAPFMKKVRKARVVGRVWWTRKGGRESTAAFGKSAALNAAGWATTAAITMAARRNPEMAPWLNTMAQHVAQHPWLALTAYAGLRGAKAYGDYRLLQSDRRMYNMDPAQTLVQNAVVGRRIPFTQKRFTRRATAGTITAGSFAIDTGKQVAVKSPIIGLGALRTNPAELFYTGAGAAMNFGVLGWRAWRDARARRMLERRRNAPIL